MTEKQKFSAIVICCCGLGILLCLGISLIIGDDENIEIILKNNTYTEDCSINLIPDVSSEYIIGGPFNGKALCITEFDEDDIKELDFLRFGDPNCLITVSEYLFKFVTAISENTDCNTTTISDTNDFIIFEWDDSNDMD